MRAPGYRRLERTKKPCEFQGGIGKDDEYRPPTPCLREFEVGPRNIKRSKYSGSAPPSRRSGSLPRMRTYAIRPTQRSSPRSLGKIGGDAGKRLAGHAVALEACSDASIATNTESAARDARSSTNCAPRLRDIAIPARSVRTRSARRPSATNIRKRKKSARRTGGKT